VVADYYSPIPDEWPGHLWDEPAPMPGVDLHLDAAVELLGELAPHIRDYDPPAKAPGTAHGYYHSNGVYPQVDAEILFGIVRHLRPSRIVEVGAGWSSRVIADAAARNADEGAAVAEHRIFDPYPPEGLPPAPAVQALTAEQIGDDVFGQLGSGDLLFIDTTHTVKPGNDVVRLLLEVLPALAPGVTVHVHDVFLPFTYPEFMFRQGLFWQEQYVLQALLAGNPGLEVLMPNYALMRLRTDDADRVAPGLSGHVLGSGFWIRTAGG
jgi:hypothetical protein